MDPNRVSEMVEKGSWTKTDQRCHQGIIGQLYQIKNNKSLGLNINAKESTRVLSIQQKKQDCGFVKKMKRTY